MRTKTAPLGNAIAESLNGLFALRWSQGDLVKAASVIDHMLCEVLAQYDAALNGAITGLANSQRELADTQLRIEALATALRPFASHFDEEGLDQIGGDIRASPSFELQVFKDAIAAMKAFGPEG